MDDFPLCPQFPPLETANFIFIVVSPSLKEGFTVEPPGNDSRANFWRNDSDLGPKVRVTGQKSELQTKSQSYSLADPQNTNRIVQ